MKKLMIILTILSVFFSTITGVYADSYQKDVEVILSDTAEIVKLGETIAITATAPKHGSTFTDKWDNAVKSFTEFDSITGSYTSKALFTPDKPGIYTISYTIDMFSGSSNTVFSKKVERTIEVIDPITVVGAAVRDLTVTPFYRADGTVSVYSVHGTTYALWSNNTATPNGSLYFFFAPNETSKDVSVALNINDKQYNYLVTVSR